MNYQIRKPEPLQLALIGLAIHAIGRIFFLSIKPLCFVLCGLGLFLFFYNIIFKKKHIFPFKGVFKGLFILYLIWSIYIIVRPFIESEASRDSFSLINQYTFLAYTVPIVCFYPTSFYSLGNVLKINIFYGCIGLCLLILFFRQIFLVGSNFSDEAYQDYIGIASVPAAFLLTGAYSLIWVGYIPKKYFKLAFIIWGIGVFTTAFMARRSGVVTYLLILLSYLFQRVSGSRNKVATLTIVIFLIFLGLGIVMSFSSTFSLLLSRLDEDTRSGVEQYFFDSFSGKPYDWLFGRGISGTYFCPIFENVNRDIIETGYLFLILKGGLVYLILFIFLLISSAFIGFFRSRNGLTKSMSFYLIMHVIALIPFGLPAFSISYVILWIFICFCQSNRMRQMSDQDIRNLFSKSN